jgi:hypothetical protein
MLSNLFERLKEGSHGPAKGRVHSERVHRVPSVVVASGY